MWVPKIFLFFCSLEAQQLRAVQSWVASLDQAPCAAIESMLQNWLSESSLIDMASNSLGRSFSIYLQYIAIYLRPLLWQAKLDHLIHAVFLHWAIAMQASRQKDLRGDISWVHSVLQWSHIRVIRVAKIDHFWGVLIPSRLLYSLLLCPWRIKHGLCRCMNGGT